MGNEPSSPIPPSTPPQTLESRTLPSLATHLLSPSTRKIVLMTGAGISTSAGIPDFRSPETGLYANLSRLNLPYAEAVFDIDFFRKNPEPFYTLAHELYPGKYRPTIAHAFIRLLHEKGKLLKCFTQNIDCLEREAGVPGEKIVEAHGSFARQGCIECKEGFDAGEIRRCVEERRIPKCASCGGLVKPGIVFFGEQLPKEFFEARSLPGEADLCIVMGTSLTVQPFASLPDLVPRSTPRLLINLERVGTLGSGADDVLLLGDCDEGVRKLAEACGWLEELEELWARTAPDAAAAAAAAAATAEKSAEKSQSKSRDEALEDEVEKLTKEIDETLNLSKWHEEKVRNESLPTDSASKPESSKESSHEAAKGNLGHVFVGKHQDEITSSIAEKVKEEKEAWSDHARESSGDSSKL